VEGIVDIQPATAENRRGKKKEETTGVNRMSASATQGGHSYILYIVIVCV